MAEHDSEVTARNAVRGLVEEAVAAAADKGWPVGHLRGIAFFDTERDARLSALTQFDPATQAIGNLPNFVGRFGREAAPRIALQFLYQYFKRVESVKYEQPAFDALWFNFTEEVQDAYWVARGVANVRNFRSENHGTLNLGDGVSIRGRSPDDLAALGFDTAIWDRISDDWSGFGASSFVLVAEDTFAKQPDNLILRDSSTVSTKAQRAIGALRLVEAGSIGIGSMWVVRAARFNVGISGLVQIGAAIPTMGTEYRCTETATQLYPAMYQALARLENSGYNKSPGNLAVALRSFMATYDRWPSYPDSQLLDSITALEALLGTESEISFKLAFRVAGLLAGSDKERSTLLKLLKEFYDTRSRVVHGGQLRQKHQGILQRVDELRAMVRRLLRSFVAYAAAPSAGYGKAFWQEQLDMALVDANERGKLRAALAIT
jgi:hypothetical protein